MLSTILSQLISNMEKALETLKKERETVSDENKETFDKLLQEYEQKLNLAKSQIQAGGVTLQPGGISIMTEQAATYQVDTPELIQLDEDALRHEIKELVEQELEKVNAFQVPLLQVHVHLLPPGEGKGWTNFDLERATSTMNKYLWMERIIKRLAQE